MPLGDMQPMLEEYIGSHPEWKPNVLGQVKSWLKDGLRDRAVTRDLPWGIQVPEEIAEAILWLLSPAASFTTGAVLRVAGGR